jgi:hypothetical protein
LYVLSGIDRSGLRNRRCLWRRGAEYADKISREAQKLRTSDPDLLSHMIRDELDRAEGKPDRLLLYIDQWEELYAHTPSSSDKERAGQHAADVNRFIDLLLNASRTAPVAVIATVRADFYDPLIAHQEIRSLLPTRQVLLGAMPRSELERTIVEPEKSRTGVRSAGLGAAHIGRGGGGRRYAAAAAIRAQGDLGAAQGQHHDRRFLCAIGRRAGGDSHHRGAHL